MHVSPLRLSYTPVSPSKYVNPIKNVLQLLASVMLGGISVRYSYRQRSNIMQYSKMILSHGKIKNAPFNHENKINAPDNWKIKIMPHVPVYSC